MEMNTTTTTTSEVPTEIVGEILLRLPVESLLRCKSVCKLWLSLISDPHFIQNHLHLSVSTRNENHHRLIWQGCATCSVSDALSSCVVNVSQADHPALRGGRDVSIVGSCNGLLCLVTWSHTVVIWNPSTRQANCLPACPYRSSTYGFGYDHSTDDYKVVAISDGYDDDGYEASSMIYSLKTGKWKDIAKYPFVDPEDPSGRPDPYSFCFANGALYWSVREPRNCWVKIVSLDLATKTYREVLQPAFDDDDNDIIDYESDDEYCCDGDCEDRFLSLGALEESLCVLHNYRGKCANVWVYGSVQDSWTKLMSIPYLTIWKDSQMYRPLFISTDGKILFLDGTDESGMLVYDSKNRSFSKIRNWEGDWFACTFVESLVSPHAPTGRH